MTPQQAFQILDQTTATVNGNRNLHLQIQEALRCIKILVDENEKKKEVQPEENPK